MKIGTRADGAPCVIDAEERVAVLDGRDGPSFGSVLELIEAGPSALALVREAAARRDPARPALGSVAWAAPIPRPRRNVICVGKNYRDHAAEFSASGFDASTAVGDVVPATPVLFSKAPESVVGPGADIEVPDGLSDQVDYEAEIAVVIGAPGRAIAADRAMAHVFGVTLVNDVTARDLQRDHKQWFLGKSIDTFCPMGPFITLAEAVSIEALRLQCRVNGALRQDARGDQLIFSVPEILATLSRSMRLAPGDVIATGTPAGVGIGMDPPQFLVDGDLVEVSADGLGTLANRVRRRPA